MSLMASADAMEEDWIVQGQDHGDGDRQEDAAEEEEEEQAALHQLHDADLPPQPPRKKRRTIYSSSIDQQLSDWTSVAMSVPARSSTSSLFPITLSHQSSDLSSATNALIRAIPVPSYRTHVPTVARTPASSTLDLPLHIHHLPTPVPSSLPPPPAPSPSLPPPPLPSWFKEGEVSVVERRLLDTSVPLDRYLFIRRTMLDLHRANPTQFLSLAQWDVSLLFLNISDISVIFILPSLNVSHSTSLLLPPPIIILISPFSSRAIGGSFEEIFHVHSLLSHLALINTAVSPSISKSPLPLPLGGPHPQSALEVALQDKFPPNPLYAPLFLKLCSYLLPSHLISAVLDLPHLAPFSSSSPKSQGPPSSHPLLP